MGELGFSDLSTEQIEQLTQTAEESARKFVLAKVSSKNLERLDISVEGEGSKPVKVTVEIDLVLNPQTTGVDAEELAKQATRAAHLAAENFLRNLK